MLYSVLQVGLCRGMTVIYQRYASPRRQPAMTMHLHWPDRLFIHEPVSYRLCPGRRRPAMPRGLQGRHFIHEPVGYRLCPGTRWWPVMSRGLQGRHFIPGPFRFGTAQGPESGVSASALTAPGSIGVARSTNSGAGSEP